MTLVINIECDNAAFDGHLRKVECLRILADVRRDLRTERLVPGDPVVLYDVNGNGVGRAEFEKGRVRNGE